MHLREACWIMLLRKALNGLRPLQGPLGAFLICTHKQVPIQATQASSETSLNFTFAFEDHICVSILWEQNKTADGRRRLTLIVFVELFTRRWRSRCIPRLANSSPLANTGAKRISNLRTAYHTMWRILGFWGIFTLQVKHQRTRSVYQSAPPSPPPKHRTGRQPIRAMWSPK